MSFRFKQFSIIDDNSSMKVGVDAVLLGAWANVNNGANILDVGSGSGIVALMMAQRYPKSKILAIEINVDSYSDLKENIINSPWNNRIEALNCDFNSYSNGEKFDLVISNPPFFESTNSNMEIGRKLARQSVSLTPSQLCNVSQKILYPKSSLIVVFPFSLRDEFIMAALKNGFYLFRELKIKDNVSSEYKRSLLHFKNSKVEKLTQEELILKHETGTYSNEFNKLTKSFYLS